MNCHVGAFNKLKILAYSLCVARVPPFKLVISANSKKNVFIVQYVFSMTLKLNVSQRLAFL